MVDLVHVPADPDHPDAWTVEGTVLVGDAVDVAIHGSTDFSLDVPTTRATLTEPHRTVHRLVAVPAGSPRVPESVVGRAMVGLPLVGNAHLAVVYVGVHPDWRRHGIGSALWDAGLDLARAAGRRTVISDSSYGTEPPPDRTPSSPRPAAAGSPRTTTPRGSRSPAGSRSSRWSGTRCSTCRSPSITSGPIPAATTAST